MDITEEHLHHMAKRNHGLWQKLESFKAGAARVTKNIVTPLEVGLGAWLGGVIHGKTMKSVDPVTGVTIGASIGPVPFELAAGLGVLAAGHFDLAGDKMSHHLENVGTGLVAAFASNKGYAFGERWKLGGFRAAIQPWHHAAAPTLPAPAAPGAAAVHGDLSPAQMATVVETMRQAAASAPR